MRCPECETAIPAAAEECPNCGLRIPAAPNEDSGASCVVLLVVVVILIALFVLSIIPSLGLLF